MVDSTLPTAAAAHAAAFARYEDARDGAGCVAALERGFQLDPADTKRFASSYARCVMLCGDCDHGTALYRQALAADASPQASWPSTPPSVEPEVREVASNECPSWTARTASDYVCRAAGEMDFAIRSRNGDLCREVFERIHSSIAAADQESAQQGAGTLWCRGRVTRALSIGAECVAAATGRCDDGYPYWRRYYAVALPRESAELVDRVARESWDTLTRVHRRVQCL